MTCRKGKTYSYEVDYFVVGTIIDVHFLQKGDNGSFRWPIVDGVPQVDCQASNVYGFAAAVTTECLHGQSFNWESQSKINNIYESNLLFPNVLFLTGHSFSIFEEMRNLVNLCSLSSRHCYNIQRAYILPEIKEVWTCHSEAIMASLAGERVIASGDARCDRPALTCIRSWTLTAD